MRSWHNPHLPIPLNLEHRFQFPLPNGLHARPASHLQEVTNRFAADITLINRRTQREANAKSVLSLVGADVKAGDLCLLIFSGVDEVDALRTVTAYLQKGFLACDEALPEIQSPSGELFLPRSLRAAGLNKYHAGIAVSPGIGRGHVVIVGRLQLLENLRNEIAADPAHERNIFDAALSAVCGAIGERVDESGRVEEKEVLKMHLSILRDQTFIGSVHELLARRLTAGQAIIAAKDRFCETLINADNSYLRERILDIEDVCNQLLEAICGSKVDAEKLRLTEPSVCVAESLTPGQFLALDRCWLKALILGAAGATSHTVILARSFNIPTIVGIAQACVLLRPGHEVIVDADHGIVIPEVTELISRYYQCALSKAARLRAKLSAFQDKRAVTTDGCSVEIAANIASGDEAAAAFEAGADGIGLFRTEMLFMDRDAAPSEEEQSAIYTTVVKAGAGRAVIIRTLDIGGDKPVPYLGLPRESNPFLGYRGVRIYGEFPGIVKTQLRAILRAAECGNVRILVPMVSSVEEVRQVKRLLAEARKELRAAGSSAADATVELGVMLEVPSVAFQLPQLCREVDFFSIGTNDLTQYFMAVDRDNRKVAPLYSAMHPAFLRLLQMLINEARAERKWIGLCGQAGEDARMLPLLIGLGVDEISLSAPRIPTMKAAVCHASFGRCEALLKTVLESATREEVEACLNAFHEAADGMPIVTPELVILDSDAVTKEEAIKELTDALHLGGRTEHPERVEEEIWRREETYSTGFGGGFAIPHCKSSSVTANSIVVLKTRPGSAGIQWGSLDQKPVHVALLLAIQAENAGKEHLKVLAMLSRQVMRDAFRERMLAETDPSALSSFILNGLSA